MALGGSSAGGEFWIYFKGKAQRFVERLDVWYRKKRRVKDGSKVWMSATESMESPFTAMGKATQREDIRVKMGDWTHIARSWFSPHLKC